MGSRGNETVVGAENLERKLETVGDTHRRRLSLCSLTVSYWPISAARITLNVSAE